MYIPDEWVQLIVPAAGKSVWLCTVVEVVAYPTVDKGVFGQIGRDRECKSLIILRWNSVNLAWETHGSFTEITAGGFVVVDTSESLGFSWGICPSSGWFASCWWSGCEMRRARDNWYWYRNIQAVERHIIRYILVNVLILTLSLDSTFWCIDLPSRALCVQLNVEEGFCVYKHDVCFNETLLSTSRNPPI